MTRLSTLSRSVAGRGALVAVTDTRIETVNAVVAEIERAGGKARGWVLDVGDDAQVAQVVPEIAAAFGRLDIVVNNAGISAAVPIDDPGYMAHWDRQLSILLTANVRVIRAALPFLRASDAARIVNIASTEALGATKLFSVYSAAKAGVTGLTRSLAVELGPEAITVNCICPGPIRTAMTALVPEKDKEIFAKRRVALQPLRRTRGGGARHAQLLPARFAVHHRNHAGCRRRADGAQRLSRSHRGARE